MSVEDTEFYDKKETVGENKDKSLQPVYMLGGCMCVQMMSVHYV